MPIYEWHCAPCEHTFEALAAFSVARRRRACPLCGKAAPRIVSAAALHVGRGSAQEETPRPSGKPDVTSLRVPPAARLCWMDDRSASRLAAYKHGRGAEYDDTLAACAETRKKRGLGETTAPAHDHSGHSQHGHSHSPLANPAVRARRAAAAKRSAAES